MTVTISPIKLTWKKIPEHHEVICEKLTSILESWEGTPYMLGVSQKKFGVDCINFVFSVIDELYGVLKRRKEYSASMCLHNTPGSLAAVRTMMEDYSPNKQVADGSVEPGDIIVTATKSGAPGHTMIAGPTQSELWHVYSKEVTVTGIGFCDSSNHIMNYFRTYRALDKHLWAQQR